MDPLAAKPFSSTKASFKGFQNREVKEKASTLPSSMPLSGDILKQRLKTMQDKSSPKRPEKKSSSTNNVYTAAPATAPIVTQKDIINRRDSMHKAPPPPPPSGDKKNAGTTPEFLRKKLKPTGKVLTYSEQDKEKKDSNENKEIREEKSNFRNSKLIFEQKATPPVAPKPRSWSKTSLGQSSLPRKESIEKEQVDYKELEKKQDIDKDQGAEIITGRDDAEPNTPKETEESDQNDQKHEVSVPDDEAKNDMEEKQDTWPKPMGFELPGVPDNLIEWMKIFANNNNKLRKLDEEDKPPPVLRELKTAANINDVAAKEIPAETEEEIYDDVETVKPQNEDQPATTNDSAPASTETIVQEELYDDVNNASGNIEEEIYDDVNAQDANNPATEEVYDDVESSQPTGYPSNEMGFDQIDAMEDGEGIYEPVETISTYVPTNAPNVNVATKSNSGQSSLSLDKASRKKEERERKEREKLEKKRKEEAEKKLKKEEEERKRREKEERKKIEKERKLFNLKPDEDPVPIERHMAKIEVKAKGKDLGFSKGEYIDIISKNNCPKGKVLAQNSFGKLGYVSMKDLGIDKRMSLLGASSPIALGVAFGDELYEEANGESERSILPISSSSHDHSLIISTSNLSHFKQQTTSSPEPASGDGNEGEEVYEMIS